MLATTALATLLLSPVPVPQEAVPAVAPEPAAQVAPRTVLTVSWPGLDAALADPRDAGLRAAMAVGVERLAALAGSPGWDGPPAPLLRLALDLIESPMDLAIAIPAEPAPGAPPVAARLELHGEAGALEALAESLPSLMQMPPSAVGDPDPEHPGLLRMESPAGVLRHGIPADDPERLIVDLGGLGAVEPIPTAGRGSRAFAVSFDTAALAPLFELARAQGDPDFAEVEPMLELLGLTGDDPPAGWIEIAHEAGRARLTSRFTGMQALINATTGVEPAPLQLSALARIPAGATYAQVSRQSLETLFGFFETMMAADPSAPDMRGEFYDATGLDLEADLLAPLGDVLGFYLAPETGGGFLSMAGFQSVDDPEAFSATLDALAERVTAPLASESQGRVRIERWSTPELPQAAGWRIVFPQLPVPLQPTLLLSEGWLYFAPFSGTARTAALLAAAAEPGSTLPESPEFQRAYAALGEVAPLSVQWSDTKSQLAANYGFVQLAGAAVDNLVLLPGVEPTAGLRPLVPPVDELVGRAQPALAVAYWDGEAYCNDGVMDGSVLANAGGIAGSYFALMFAIGAGSSVAIPQMMMAQQSALEVRGQAEAHTLVMAMEQYAVDHGGEYPASVDALTRVDENGNAYLSTIPTDPWGRPLVYIAPTDDNPWPTVLSYGADGVEGGFGEDEDVYYY